jgi:hypothetical protein
MMVLVILGGLAVGGYGCLLFAGGAMSDAPAEGLSMARSGCVCIALGAVTVVGRCNPARLV